MIDYAIAHHVSILTLQSAVHQVAILIALTVAVSGFCCWADKLPRGKDEGGDWW